MKAGWQVKKLGEVCTVIAGQSPEGKFYNALGDGLPFYQGKKEFSEKYIGKPTTWTTFVTKEAEKDDVLMSVRAPVGPINFSTEKICIGRGLAAIRASKLINKDFLFNFLLKHEAEIVGNTGAVFDSINKNQIENISIPVPQISEQQRIVAILDQAFEGIAKARANAERNLQNARALFESYLQSVFTQRGEGWKEEKLADVCEVKDGTHDSPQYVLAGIPFVTQKNIREDGLSFETTKYITAVDHQKFYKRSNVTVNDVLISMIGANRGMACLVDDNRIFSIKNVGLIKSNHLRVLPKFLLYFLKSPKAQEYVKSQSKGGAQEFIGLTELRKFPIAFPELSKQEIVTSQLDGLSIETQRLEALYQRKIELLDELKKSLLQHAFAGEL